VKAINLRLILGLLITSLFISSCASTDADEISGIERALQGAIERKVDNCESLLELTLFASYKNIDLDEASEESQIATANLFKKYALEVLEISKRNNHFNRNKYLRELENAIQEIDMTNLPDTVLENIGKKYFPDCGYFQTAEVLNDPLEQENASENAISSDSNKNSDVILKAPSLVFWGIPFQITANSSDRDFEYCIFKFGGSNSMYAETLGKVFASNGVAEITHTLVWNGGLGSTAWSKYWAVCSVDGREFEIDSVDVQGAR
jgi:hypothetical protein